MKKVFLFLVCLLAPFFMVLGSEKEKLVNEVNYAESSAVPYGTMCLVSCEGDFLFEVTGDPYPRGLRVLVNGVDTMPFSPSTGQFTLSGPLANGTIITLAYFQDGFWHLYSAFIFKNCYCSNPLLLPICHPDYPECD